MSGLAGAGLWSIALQVSRVGTGALVFLALARHLPLEALGAFAAAAAAPRFVQALQKGAVEDVAVILGGDRDRETALFLVSVALAGVATLAMLGVAVLLAGRGPEGARIGATLAQGVAAVPDGALRRTLRQRTLALRTMASQGLGLVATVAAWQAGAGVWALVVFAVVQGISGSVIAWRVAGWRPGPWGPARAAMGSLAAPLGAIGGRVALGALIQPGVQLAATLAFGLAAGGLLQVAQRIVALLDALAVEPARSLALPMVARLRDRPERLRGALLRGLGLATAAAALGFLGAMAVAPDLLAVLLGPGVASQGAPTLAILCGLGPVQAASAVLTQGLVATGRARVALWRMAGLVTATTLLGLPALAASLEALALAQVAAAVVVLTALLALVPRHLGLGRRAAVGAMAGPLLAGVGMTAGVRLLATGPLAGWEPAARLPLLVLAGGLLFAGLLPLLTRGLIPLRRTRPA